MQFSVPQFIDVEDKIFGDLTFKQFIYVIGGVGSAYFAYAWLPQYFGLPLAAIIIGFALALAFYRYNERPFVILLESAFYYLVRSRLYLWKQRPATELEPEKAGPADALPPAQITVPSLSDSKLKQLSWSLDINEYVERAAKK